MLTDNQQHSRSEIRGQVVPPAAQPHGYDYANDRSLDVNIPPVCFFKMFRYADRWDYLLLAVGLVCAMANGVGLVFYANPYGDLTQAFAPGADPNFIVDKTKNAVYSFLKNAAVVFVASWLMSATWAISSERQAIRCRMEYLKAILRQEPGWHERQKSTEIAEKMHSETSKLQVAIGIRAQTFLMSTSLIVGGVTIALVRGWKLAIILMSFIPVMFVTGLISNCINRKADSATDKISNRLSGNALEVLQNVRTVKALGGQYYESNRFQKTLTLLHNKLINYHMVKEILGSLYFFCIIMNYTIGFWLGSNFVSRGIINDNSHEMYSVADVIVIFFTLYTSNLNMGQLPDCLTAFQVGGRSAARIASVVDRSPLIVDGGETVPKVQELTFNNVTFRYENPLFESLNLNIRKGRTAFVGESGSGKSTIVSLIMRFYDPLAGQVTINGRSLKEFNLASLKENIGYVGQQPVLLGKTLREALIAEDREDGDIIRALKAAEAWTFVKDIGLDAKYGQLSGGQKQRVAIARALLKSPQILILDEATSALDRRNEKEIQSTIDRLDLPFVVMIAHKIETISKADWIYVLDHGRVIQQGTYPELIQQRQGKFFELADAQRAIPGNLLLAPQPAELESKSEKGSQDDELLEKRKSQKEEDSQQKQFRWAYVGGLFRMNLRYLPLFVLLLVCAMYMGCIFPLFSFYIARIIVLLTNIRYSPEDDRTQFVAQAQRLSLILLIISVVGYFVCYIRATSMKVVEQRLIQKLKSALYEKLLKMSASFFDLNGSCTAVLGDCNKAAALASTTPSSLSQNIAAMVLGLSLAFYSCWQITLVSLALIPVLLIAGKIQMQFVSNYSAETDDANKRCHQQVVEALLNYKTVISFNLQDKFVKRYQQLLEQPLKIAVKRGNITGVTFGFAQGIISCVFALIFFLAALFIRDYHVGVLEAYTAIYAIMFAAISAGGNLGFLGGISDSKVALVNVMNILNNQELAEEYGKGAIQQIQGKVEFRQVGFSYPLRKSPVLNRLSFTIEAGKKVAFVGASGCGKSTVIALLLRLYEPSHGSILIDDRSLREFDLLDLRLNYGVVSQQPVLFNRTVYENIRYNQSAEFDDIVQAAQQANAYNFIYEANFGVSELANEEEPEFEEEKRDIKLECFARKVGNKGSFLSGGQKQRVAIARALVRKPRIILLDEATSALDSKNQSEIQAALDSISGQTQIIVAHRLSTIRNCDSILVFDKGDIVEKGTFTELLEIRGHFYRLAMGQNTQG